MELLIIPFEIALHRTFPNKLFSCTHHGEELIVLVIVKNQTVYPLISPEIGPALSWAVAPFALRICESALDKRRICAFDPATK